MSFYPSVIILAASFFSYSAVKAEQLCIRENGDPLALISEISQRAVKPYEFSACNGDGYASRSTNLSVWLAERLGLAVAPIIVWNQDDLRFVPQTLNGSELLLVLNDLHLSEKQLNKVAAVLAVKGMPVHLVWLGTQLPPPFLTEFVKKTKGRTWEYSAKMLGNEPSQQDSGSDVEQTDVVSAI